MGAADRLFLLELDGYTDVATHETLRYCMRQSGGYRTLPTDTPPNTPYRDLVVSIGAIARSMFAGGLASGDAQPSSALSAGFASLANIDGALDSTFGNPAAMSFNEREARVYLLPAANAPYASAQLVQRTLITQPEPRDDTIDILQSCRLYQLDTPHLTNTYLGNNSGSSGLEGGPELAGKVKPLLIGTAYQIQPHLVNAPLYIYQVCTNALLSATLYDGRQTSYTVGADYASQADMLATAPAALEVRWWKAGGMFRLGTKSAFTLTVDATADTAPNSTAAQLLKRLAQDRGISGADVSTSDVTALDSATTAVLGKWIGDNISTRALMDLVAGSVGAYWHFDRLNVLRMGRLELPSAPAGPVPVIAPWGAAKLQGVVSGEDIPVTTVRLKYAQYLSVEQGSQISGSVSAAAAADYAQAWRSVEVTATPSPNPYARTRTIERETLFAYKADALAEANRLLAQYGQPLRTFLATDVPLDVATLLALDLNGIVDLRWHRHGFSRSTSTWRRVINIPRLDIAAGVADITLWGT